MAFLRLRDVHSEKTLPLRGPLPVCQGRTLFRPDIDSDFEMPYGLIIDVLFMYEKRIVTNFTIIHLAYGR